LSVENKGASQEYSMLRQN